MSGVVAAVVLLCCGIGAFLSDPKATTTTPASARTTIGAASPTASDSPTPTAVPIISTPSTPPTTQAAPSPPPPTTAAAKAAPPPPPPPPPTTQKQVNLCGAPSNPYGYNFCGGSYIYSPESDICSYINCISSFWNGTGYVEQCQDGMFSKSGGHSGSCSHHGGNRRPLYKP